MTESASKTSTPNDQDQRIGSRVAVVIPNYNHGHYLAEALSSIAAQTIPPDRVLIIDDASTDNSIEVISGFLKSNPTWELIRHTSRQGVVFGQNEAIMRADADWLTFLGADDALHSTYLETAHRQIALKPNAGVVCGCCETIGDVATRTLRPILLPATSTRAISASQFRSLLKLGDNYFVGTTTMYRRGAILDLGGFDPALGSFADAFLARQIACQFGLVFIPEILGYWRTHGKNYSILTSTDPQLIEEKLQLIRRVIDACEGMFPKNYALIFDRRTRFGSGRLAALTTTVSVDERVHRISEFLSANSLERHWLKALLSLGRFGKFATLAWLAVRLRPMSLPRLASQFLLRRSILARTSAYKP